MLQALFHLLASLLAKQHLYITKSLCYTASKPLVATNLDYVRYATLSLCCQTIIQKKLDGNIAEVGVYKGDFAKRLNAIFPHKKLYLFDTFEGFASHDIKIEIANNYSAATQDFSATSIALVKAKMPNAHNCIFKQGIFPSTAADVHDTFCFVSLDADLYTPIYEGLQFFYPKLVKGGYIFIHDYNNAEYSGASKAVQQFCAEQQISIVPLPDIGGTVVITK